jgi:membrane protease YdiL (CAAX protease family)
MFAADLDNPWIVDVRRARRRTPAVLVALAGLGVAGALLAAAQALGRVAGTDLAAGLAFAVLIALAVLAGRWEGRRIWRPETYGAGAIVGGLALGLGVVLAAAALASMAGSTSVLVSPPSASPVAALAGGVFVAALGAVAQEAWFRGWMQPALCASWGPWPGLAAVAVVFAGLHLLLGAPGVLGAVNLALAGLVLGLLALRSGGLAAPTAAHLVWTWIGFAGLGTVTDGRIVGVRLQGPALWTGGSEGLGASFAATAILVILFVTLVLVRPQATLAETRADGS